MSLLKTTRKKSSSNVKMLHFCFANNTMLLNMNFFYLFIKKVGKQESKRYVE